MTCNFFQPIYNTSCQFVEDLRFLDVEHTKQEREIYNQYFIEQVEQFGQEVDYIVNEYDKDLHCAMYGEHTTKNFADPVKLISYVVMNDDSVILNQFGIEGNGDITVFIPIDRYKHIFGEDSEPKSGDLIRLTEYGSTNRPNGRGEEVFEITHRDDQTLNQTIPLMGHYVWMIWAKRYDYSYENNVQPENLINQINDDVFQSKGLSGTPSDPNVADNVDKTYDGSADELGKLIFDYDKKEKSNDSVYGDY
jgi:hypothetical protein